MKMAHVLICLFLLMSSGCCYKVAFYKDPLCEAMFPQKSQPYSEPRHWPQGADCLCCDAEFIWEYHGPITKSCECGRNVPPKRDGSGHSMSERQDLCNGE